MATYNGWNSWNAWNVNLWITNEEYTYNKACELVRQYGVERAAAKYLCWVGFTARTPDGAKYTKRSLVECFRSLL